MHATGANKCYEIDTSSDSDTIIIWVEEGCEITDTVPLANLLDVKKIYGDDYTQPNDIKQVQRRYNDTCGVLVWKSDGDHKVFVDIKISNANKPFKIFRDYRDHTGTNCIIKIKKKATVTSVAFDDSSSINQPTTKPSNDEAEKHQEEKMDTPRWLIIWMSILSVVVLVWCIFVTRRLIPYKTYYDNLLIKENDLSTRIKSLEKQIFTEEQVRQLIIDTQKQTDTAKDKEIKQTGTTTHVEKAKVQSPPAKPKEPKVELLDTTDVECNLENDFFSLKHNDKPMFRIYQKGDVFYYSLIEEIKKDMPSMLGGTEKFITVNRSTSSIPQGVEVVKEGIVINEGNGIFRVDSNNKLVINII